MNAKNTGAQPAFPTQQTEIGEENGCFYPFVFTDRPGLTKRELFAAMAMQGILSNEVISRAVFARNTTLGAAIAAAAIGYSDSLLTELAKE